MQPFRFCLGISKIASRLTHKPGCWYPLKASWLWLLYVLGKASLRSCQASLTAPTPEAQDGAGRSFHTVAGSSILQICFPSRYFMKMGCQSSWWDRSVCLYLSVAGTVIHHQYTLNQAQMGRGEGDSLVHCQIP